MKMQKFLAIILSCLVLFGAMNTTMAQDKKKKQKSKALTTIVEKADKYGIGDKIPGWSLIRAKATGKKTLLGLSLGYGNLGLSDFGFNGSNATAPSIDGGTQWNIRTKIIFYRSHSFSIHTGIGYESDILKLNNLNATLWDSTLSPTNMEGKLVARYITIPLQFKYKFSSSFSLHAGLIGGINFNTSHTGKKYFWEENNIDYSAREDYNDFNPLKLDVQAGFTLYHITFYAKYGITDMFKSDAVYSCHPFTWGISLGI